MNHFNKQNKNVLAIVASIAILSSFGLVSTVQAHTPLTLPYGEVGQEDETYFFHDGMLYINAVPSQGNGLFISEPDLDDDYTVDQAIDRFGIDEDARNFVVEPSVYSNVGLFYQFNDETLFFELIGAVEQ